MPEIAIQTDPVRITPITPCLCSQPPLFENCGPDCRYDNHNTGMIITDSDDEIMNEISFDDFELDNSDDEVLCNISLSDFQPEINNGDTVIITQSQPDISTQNNFASSRVDLDDWLASPSPSISVTSNSEDEILCNISVSDFTELPAEDTIILSANHPAVQQSPPVDLDDSYYESTPENSIRQLAATIGQLVREQPIVIDLVTPENSETPFIDLVTQQSENVDLDATLNDVESLRGSTPIVEILMQPNTSKLSNGKYTDIGERFIQNQPIIPIYSPSQSANQDPVQTGARMMPTQEFNNYLAGPSTSKAPITKIPQPLPKPQKIPGERRHFNKRTKRYENTQEVVKRELANKRRRESYQKKTGSKPRKPRQINRNKEDFWSVQIRREDIFGQMSSTDEDSDFI